MSLQNITPPPPDFWHSWLPFLFEPKHEPSPNSRPNTLNTPGNHDTLECKGDLQKATPLATRDGSPSLSHTGEPMHNRTSAFQETCYVYGPALQQFLQTTPQGTLGVVGFGAGYIECLFAALCVTEGASKPTGRIYSFESDFFLYQWFETALNEVGKGAFPFAAASDLDSQMVCIAGSIIAGTAYSLNLDPIKLAAFLLKAIRCGSWQRLGKLEDLIFSQENEDSRDGDYPCATTTSPNKVTVTKFSGICFDAYSEKSAPNLWQEETLQQLLLTTEDPCVFASYAAKGQLTRLLRNNGFSVNLGAGFAGKRNCTWAIKDTKKLNQ